MRETLVIKIDGGLWRVIAMTGAITEVAKKRPVRVITSRPLAFWGNPYIKSVHWLDDRNLFEDVIKWNDYFELEPYTDPDFFNDWVNRLDIAAKQLWLESVAQPQLFLAEHEKFENILSPSCNPKVLYQPFGSSVENEWGADRSYRSFYIKDAQYIADNLIKNWIEVYEVIKPGQPILQGCQILDTPNMRWVVSLCDRYPVIWCDSCLHHASKAFDKRAVVMRAGTDAERFWYESNINLREHPMVAHTPMRLPMNSFNYDISNQYTNIFSKEFLDKFIEESLSLIYDIK